MKNLLDWNAIDTVLLDLDGTLLDLAFDSYFWHEVIPQHYGDAHGLEAVEARAEIAPMFRACEGTIDWYCVDYWSRTLQLDVMAIKQSHRERVRWLPGAQEFLRELRERGKRVVMLTSSHPKVLALKHERTQVCDHFDAVFTSHEFGMPKEDARYWSALRKVEEFDPRRTLFVDDNLAVLRSALAADIAFLRAVRRPDSMAPPREQDEFTAVDAVNELL
ncbi:MAG: GMP/IMP nucleotidase [Steroidobacteraceae bacterium]